MMLWPTVLIFVGMMMMLMQFLPDPPDESQLVAASKSLREAYKPQHNSDAMPPMQRLLETLDARDIH